MTMSTQCAEDLANLADSHGAGETVFFNLAKTLGHDRALSMLFEAFWCAANDKTSYAFRASIRDLLDHLDHEAQVEIDHAHERALREGR